MNTRILNRHTVMTLLPHNLGKTLRYLYSARRLAWCLILVSAAIKAVIVLRSHYYWDDFLILSTLGEHLRWSDVWHPYDGHTMPLTLSVLYGVNALAPYNWLVVAGIVISLHIFLGVASWKLFSLLLTRVPAEKHFLPYTREQGQFLALLPLCFILLSPLSFVGWSWWSAGLNTLPMLIAMVIAVRCAFHIIDGHAVYASYAIAGFACIVALLFYEKAVIIPWMVIAVVVMDKRLGCQPYGNWKRWAPWCVFAGVMTLYALWALSHVSSVPGKRNGVQAIELTGFTLLKIIPNSLFGGAYGWTRFPPGPPLAYDYVPGMIICSLLLIFFVIYLRRRKLLIIVGAFLGYVVCSVTPIYYARSSVTTSAVLASGMRYTADISVMLAILLAMVVRYAHREEVSVRPVSLSIGWKLWAVVYTLSATVSAFSLSNTVTIASSKPYIQGIKKEIAAGHTFFDQKLPTFLLTPLGGKKANVSRVFASLHPQIVTTKRRLERIGDDGRLHAESLPQVRTLLPSSGNIYPLSGPLVSFNWIVHIQFPPIPYDRTLFIRFEEKKWMVRCVPRHWSEAYIRVQGGGKTVEIQGIPHIEQGEILRGNLDP